MYMYCYFLLERTKNNSVFVILPFETFNESLNNDIVNFEQLALIFIPSPREKEILGWTTLNAFTVKNSKSHRGIHNIRTRHSNKE